MVCLEFGCVDGESEAGGDVGIWSIEQFSYVLVMHADSIISDLQRGLTGQTFTTHTTLNTDQNQLAIKVSADN